MKEETHLITEVGANSIMKIPRSMNRQELHYILFICTSDSFKIHTASDTKNMSHASSTESELQKLFLRNKNMLVVVGGEAVTRIQFNQKVTKVEKLASFQTLEVLNYSSTSLKGKLDLAPTGDLGFEAPCETAVLHILL